VFFYCLLFFLGDIPRFHRSKLDSIFTVIVADQSVIASAENKDEVMKQVPVIFHIL
jgi:hypothetical protein